ncbi:MAG: hypothetical protein ACM3S1_13455 [Hyphomicrobiales bacterium]
MGPERAPQHRRTFRELASTTGKWLALATVGGCLLAAAQQTFAESDGSHETSVVLPATVEAYTRYVPLLARDGAMPVGQQEFATAATATVANGKVTVTASVRTALPGKYVVDFELYAANGVRVNQQWFDQEPFSANQQRSFTITWTPPAGTKPGTYIAKIGIFAPGPEWATLYHWNDSAATFTLP